MSILDIGLPTFRFTVNFPILYKVVVDGCGKNFPVSRNPAELGFSCDGP
jgi:hypothetical protein